MHQECEHVLHINIYRSLARPLALSVSVCLARAFSLSLGLSMSISPDRALSFKSSTAKREQPPFGNAASPHVECVRGYIH